MTFPQDVAVAATTAVIGRCAMHQERLIDLGWTLPLVVEDPRQATILAMKAFEQYCLY